MWKIRAETKRHGSRNNPAKRSRREWAVRGALATCVVLVGYASLSNTLANVLVRADAEAANKVAFGDGRIMAASVAQGFVVAPDTAATSEQAVMAKEALLRDPTAVEALNVLGVQAQMRSEDDLADKLFGYSVALSRRELGPQIWSIEKAVSQGDIDRALHNYDVAMSTSENARQVLFPVLASAIAEPSIRQRVVALLVNNPAWRDAFIQHASTYGAKPDAVAELFRESAAKGIPIEEEDRARLVNRLVARELMDDAWAYYQTFRPHAQRDSSRDPNFGGGIKAPAPFDWNVGNTPGLSAAILRGGDGGFLDFAAPAGTRATVVRQIQMLPPGDYHLSGRSRGIDQPDRSRPFWVISCRAGAELGRWDLPNSADDVGTFSGQFSVPSDCPVQTLSLVIRASDKISGVTGQIENLQVVPAGQ